jgi:fucose permease
VGHQIGGALMAYISGVVHDSIHSYVMAFFMAGFMCLIATLLVITVPQPELNAWFNVIVTTNFSCWQ